MSHLPNQNPDIKSISDLGDSIVRRILTDELSPGSVLYIDGGAGVGKSHLANYIHTKLSMFNKPVKDIKKYHSIGSNCYDCYKKLFDSNWALLGMDPDFENKIRPVPLLFEPAKSPNFPNIYCSFMDCIQTAAKPKMSVYDRFRRKHKVDFKEVKFEPPKVVISASFSKKSKKDLCEWIEDNFNFLNTLMTLCGCNDSTCIANQHAVSVFIIDDLDRKEANDVSTAFKEIQTLFDRVGKYAVFIVLSNSIAMCQAVMSTNKTIHDKNNIEDEIRQTFLLAEKVSIKTDEEYHEWGSEIFPTRYIEEVVKFSQKNPRKLLWLRDLCSWLAKSTSEDEFNHSFAKHCCELFEEHEYELILIDNWADKLRTNDLVQSHKHLLQNIIHELKRFDKKRSAP